MRLVIIYTKNRLDKLVISKHRNR